MAFSVEATMKGYEVRHVGGGVSQKGNQYKTIKLEGPDGYQAEVSCTKPELFASVDRLKKTQIVNLDVRCVSSQKTSFISLLREPVLVNDTQELGY